MTDIVKDLKLLLEIYDYRTIIRVLNDMFNMSKINDDYKFNDVCDLMSNTVNPVNKHMIFFKNIYTDVSKIFSSFNMGENYYIHCNSYIRADNKSTQVFIFSRDFKDPKPFQMKMEFNVEIE
jgi:hypothetical protein